MNNKFKSAITWLVPVFVGMAFAILVSFTEGASQAIESVAGIIGVTYTHTIRALSKINKKLN